MGRYPATARKQAPVSPHAPAQQMPEAKSAHLWTRGGPVCRQREVPEVCKGLVALICQDALQHTASADPAARKPT